MSASFYSEAVFSEEFMTKGHFYFIKDEFYDALPNCGLMINKASDVELKGGRPCHYCLEVGEYYWMIPISSQVTKYQKLYDHKTRKYGKCDTIVFGYVNGEKRAFLVQNCFPVTQKYIDCEYTIQNGTVPVTISQKLSDELDKIMQKVVKMYNKGITLPLTDISKITNFLHKDILKDMRIRDAKMVALSASDHEPPEEESSANLPNREDDGSILPEGTQD